MAGSIGPSKDFVKSMTENMKGKKPAFGKMKPKEGGLKPFQKKFGK